MSSLLSRDPVLALRFGEVRVTFVPTEGDERPAIQVVDPAPRNFVLDNGLEVMRFVEAAQNSGVLPTSLACYNSEDTVVGEYQIDSDVGRLVLNFTELGSATAALILLLTGTPVKDIDWDKVFPADIVGNPKAPSEVEAFIRWHKLGAMSPAE